MQALKKIESTVSYELIRVIGQGSFAKVYLSRRIGFGLDRYVAVKITDVKNMDDRYREAIIEEVRISGHLSHPNILHVYDCGLIKDHYFFMVCELVDGYSLREVIAQHTRKVMNRLGNHGPIPISLMKHAAASILMHAAQGLDYIHNARNVLTGDSIALVHNDLKPGNILFTMNGSLKVSDFGISYSPMRSVRMKGGTPGYMAPEQIQTLLNPKQSSKPRPTSDIYSLGVCLHETLTDRRLFQAPRQGMKREDLLKSIYEQMKHVTPGLTKKINPAAEPHLCSIVDRCLQFEPVNRYQSVREIIQEVDSLIRKGVFLPEIFDKRFLAEYLHSLFDGKGLERFWEKAGKKSETN